MSSTYMPTSNWTHRTLKGRDLSDRQRRLLEPVSLRELPKKATATKQPVVREEPSSDGLMDQIQATLDINRSASGGDLMDRPMDEVVAVQESAAIMDMSMDAPSGVVTGQSIMDIDLGDSEIGARAVESPVLNADQADDGALHTEQRTYSQNRSAVGGRKALLMAAPVALAAVAAVGFLALNNVGAGSSEASLPLAQPVAADTALVGMPVSDASRIESEAVPNSPEVEGSAAASETPVARTAERPPAPASQASVQRRAAPEPAVVEPVSADPAASSIAIEPTAPVAVTPVVDATILEPIATPVATPEPIVVAEPPPPAATVTPSP